MTLKERIKARLLYGQFFKLYPGIRNPSDINRREKFHYAVVIGWEDLHLMQTARKSGYDWTRPEYWK